MMRKAYSTHRERINTCLIFSWENQKELFHYEDLKKLKLDDMDWIHLA
jgi:hypothetical protein